MKAKNINHAFFNSWTEESAYVLGFMYADGNIHKAGSKYKMSMSNQDYVLLEDIRRAMSSEHKITSYKDNDCYILPFMSDPIAERLLELGLVERKSNVVEFPQDVPRRFLSHFVRGYFDGNGHFTYELHKKDKRRMVSGFTTGSKLFADGLNEALYDLGLKHANVHHVDRRGQEWRGQYYQFRYYVGDTKKLYNIMYNDATIYMKKKKEYFEQHEGI